MVPWDNHHLRSLADSLPDVALAGRASSAATKYSATYARWKRRVRDQGLPAIPESPYHFTLYFSTSTLNITSITYIIICKLFLKIQKVMRSLQKSRNA